MRHCEICKHPLNPEITGMNPWCTGYVCNICRDKAGEDFCKALDEIDGDVCLVGDPSMSFEKLIEKCGYSC